MANGPVLADEYCEFPTLPLDSSNIVCYGVSMETRRELLDRILADGRKLSWIARKLGISRQNLYEWAQASAKSRPELVGQIKRLIGEEKEVIVGR